MKFRSTYLEPDGRVVTALLEAEQEDHLVHRLHEQGRILLRSRAVDTVARGLGRPIPAKTLFAFTQAMQSLLDAGVPVLAALEAIRGQERDERVRRVYVAITERVSEGQPLADALAAFPRSFPRLYVEIVRAGEMTGSIHTAFGYLAEFLEWQSGLRALVKQASMYPLVLLGATYALVLAMLGFTIPQLADMIRAISDDLPPSSRILLGASEFVSQNMGAVLLATIAAALGVRAAARTYTGQRLLVGLLAELPIARGVVRSVNRARLCRTMHLLMTSGVTLLAALRMCAQIVTQPAMSDALGETGRRLVEGESISSAMQQTEALPPLALVIVKSGEESGDLGAAFSRLSTMYDAESRQSVKTAIGILEPLMTVVLAAIVVAVAGVVINTLYGALQGLQ